MKDLIKTILVLFVIIAAAAIIAYIFIKSIDVYTDYCSSDKKEFLSKIDSMEHRRDSLTIEYRKYRAENRMYDRDSWNDSKEVDEFLNREE